MCGRFALSANARQLVSAAEKEDLHDVQPLPDADWEGDRYNVAPQTRVPVLRRGNNGLVFELMLWGLIPHWTKTAPDAATRLKTINARDDTVNAHGGMWQSIKGRKRGIVLCDGFYEWLKKGGDRLPHFTKRSDGHPLAMAALWDSVTYEGETESIESVTIVTTDSNKQLAFLHDRMPVILPDTQSMLTWLDTSSKEWSPDVAKLLKPYEGQLTCYPVAKEVGKVGQNSKEFVVPVSERKGNLHSFFAKAQAKADASPKSSPKKEEEQAIDQAPSVNSETNAPIDVSPSRKRERSTTGDVKSKKKPKVEAKPKIEQEAAAAGQPIIDLDSDHEEAKGEMAKTGKIDAFVQKS